MRVIESAVSYGIDTEDQLGHAKIAEGRLSHHHTIVLRASADLFSGSNNDG